VLLVNPEQQESAQGSKIFVLRLIRIAKWLHHQSKCFISIYFKNQLWGTKSLKYEEISSCEKA
jgi:hypothetical protein